MGLFPFASTVGSMSNSSTEPTNARGMRRDLRGLIDVRDPDARGVVLDAEQCAAGGKQGPQPGPIDHAGNGAPLHP